MLTIVGGPMFAGKTTWLLKKAKKLSPGSYMVFKPSIDNRYSEDSCVSHNGDKLPAVNLDSKKPKFPQMNGNISTLFIDELNFFDSKRLLTAVKGQIAKERRIIGVGLLYDVQKRPFGATLPLSKAADEFIELYAVCDGCGKKANHTYRKTKEKAQVILGAGETYGACCELCWEKL